MWDNMLYFNLAAFPIYIILWFTTIYRKMTKGRTNVLYLTITIAAFLTVFFEIGAHLGMKTFPLSPARVVYVRIMEYGYFVTRNAVNALYLFFIYSVTRNWYRILSMWKKLLLMLPYFGILVLLISNEFTHYVFTVTRDIGYHRGDHILIVYALASYYLIYGMLFLFAQRRTVSFGEWVALFATYAFNVAAVLIQFFNPVLLVECFFTSLTLLFVILFIQRPESQVDIRTGLPSYHAFREEMHKIKVTGAHIQVIIVPLLNAEEMRRFLGIEDYYAYIKVIENTLKKIKIKKGLPADIFFEHPGTFHIIMEDVGYNVIFDIDEIREEIREHDHYARPRGVAPLYKIVNAYFPEDIDTPKELFRFSRDLNRYIDVDHTFNHVSDIIARREYQIEMNMSEILERAIRDRKLKIDLIPGWSVEEQRYYSAEVALRLVDTVFGEIDEHVLREAASARGLTLQLNEYILDRVFSYAGSKEFTESGYEVIAIRLSTFQCMQPNFVSQIQKLSENYQVYPSKICFSIRESPYDSSSTKLDQNLKALQRQGYRMCLYGYGRGFVNMHYVLQMTIDSVRLDESIIEDASTAKGRALLRGTIQTLKSIPLYVIAPAGNSEETFRMLVDMGCDMVVRGG